MGSSIADAPGIRAQRQRRRPVTVDPNVVLPFLSSGLSFVFAALVADQWWRRRQPYQLVWTIGLVWFAIGAGVEFLAAVVGWSGPLYRTWYIVGAFGVACYLGLGTIYLLNRTRFGYFVAGSFGLAGLFSFLTAMRYAREGDPAAPMTVALAVGGSLLAALALALVTRFERRWLGHVSAAILVTASVIAAVVALSVPLATPGFAVDATTGAPTGAAMPSDVRILTPPFNIVGALSLIFGALYSAYIFMPKRRAIRPRGGAAVVGLIGRAGAVLVNLVASLPDAWRAFRAGELNSRVPATILIAIGGIILGSADGLTRFGVTWMLFLGQFLGVVFIFLGFLVSIEVFSDVRLPFTRIVLARRDPRDQRDTAVGEAEPAPEPAH